MDQQELREFENRCVQEQPAYCVAACPLHVDVRTFVSRLIQGQWDAARGILSDTMPVPGILARICDHPCEDACRRGAVGDAVSIGSLERTCVQSTAGQRGNQVLSPRDQRVAVVRSGLSSLAVAWDLIRKGYEVTILAEREPPGGTLHDLPDSLLPSEAIAEEVSELKRLGVQIVLQGQITSDSLDSLTKKFDALYVGFDARDIGELGLEFDDTGRVKVNPVTMATGRQGVFAGGMSYNTLKRSWIVEASEGRRAATSIDRYLQKVSLVTGREAEGAFSSRLYTDLAKVCPVGAEPMADPVGGYSPEEAVLEAKRCLQCECLECVKACVYLERFGGYPAKYARDIYTFESVSLWRNRANSLINSCSLCGLCEVVCPEGLSMADVCHKARSTLVKGDRMPPSAHDFALQDMLFSNSDQFSLARNEPGCEKSSFAFFPGCQLGASAPAHVKQVYTYLRETLAGGVGLILSCCGAPAHWAQRQELFQSGLQALRDQWATTGKPRLVIACPTCYSMFSRHMPEIEIESLWELLERVGLPEPPHAPTAPRQFTQPLAVQDPCTARHEQAMQESVRRLLGQLGCEVAELSYSGQLTQCCGYGGLMANANPPLARDVARRRSEQSPLDYVTYCAMCRDNLSNAGKRTLHLLDLIWDSDGSADPAARKGPGLSQRHENRRKLKDQFLREIWGDGEREMDDYQKIALRFAPGVQELMEERRILLEDIQKVVDYAEKSGNKLYNPHTSHWLAYYKPVKVTYWVEYSPVGDEFVIHGAYSHRMEILGDAKK